MKNLTNITGKTAYIVLRKKLRYNEEIVVRSISKLLRTVNERKSYNSS